jgi:chlorophyll synthase
MARQIVLLLALACSCAGFRAPAAAGRATRPALSRRAWKIAMDENIDPKAAETNAEASDGSAGLRQLLGLKGASSAEGSFLNWKIRLQLMKPGTWVPLIWGVACGAAASGNYHSIWNLFGDAPTTDSWGVVTEDTFKALGAMVLSGPLLCGFTQTCNDWFDRDLDAINEPYRPIPSGAIS